jgi:hypothetical protein
LPELIRGIHVFGADLMGYEVDFLPVGNSNGDAICVRWGTPDNFFLNVIDGAFKETGDQIVDHIHATYGTKVFINNMVLSHADNDHAPGLIEVLRRIEVRHLWMNRPWLYAREVVQHFHGNFTEQGLADRMRELHPYLIELEKIATEKKIPISELFQGAVIGAFTVLAPSRERYIRLIPGLEKTPQSYADKSVLERAMDAIKGVAASVFESFDIETLSENPPATTASNETSVVQLGVFDSGTVLLTADVGPEGLNEAADYAALLGRLKPPTFVQVPHHGSRRNVTPSILNRWLGEPLADPDVKRGTAFVSIGKDADIYPRKRVKNAFIRRGYIVHATRGTSRRHSREFGERDGWVASVPEAFSEDVDD